MKLTDIIKTVERYEDGVDAALCNTNGVVRGTKIILQNNETYIRTKRIDGSHKYTWSERFIELLISTLESGEYASFGKEERKIVDEYTQYINGTLTVVPEYILELDKKLGEMI